MIKSNIAHCFISNIACPKNHRVPDVRMLGFYSNTKRRVIDNGSTKPFAPSHHSYLDYHAFVHMSPGGMLELDRILRLKRRL
jgi:hypothetical protein